ncbi:HAD family hydrolase [Paenibacillus solani]|uniref:HAD family hydrolase n=1 Tax=Paenibacillus solani TaxID=1705565 RepID=UPI0006C89EA8|nr:HAD hydrolase family protein [Paenibacillus solani]
MHQKHPPAKVAFSINVFAPFPAHDVINFYHYNIENNSGLGKCHFQISISGHHSILPEYLWLTFTQASMGLIKEYQATYLIDGDWDYAYTGAMDHPILNNLDTLIIAKKIPIELLDKVVKVLILSATNAEELSEKLVPLDVVIHKHSNENLIDISPKNIHKWSALQKIGTTEKGFIAFGNDANDISMFKEARYSVRIGNHEKLGKYADETISLEGDYEQKIIDKLEELSHKYYSFTEQEKKLLINEKLLFAISVEGQEHGPIESRY